MNYAQTLGERAKVAAPAIANASPKLKNEALAAIAAALLQQTDRILQANAEDLAAAVQNNMTESLQDRLRLTPARMQGMADAIEKLIAMDDPVGVVESGSVRPNGLQILKTRVPLGIIGIIFESRPNVTVDAATLCLKAGNAVILRGGKEAGSCGIRWLAGRYHAAGRRYLSTDCQRYDAAEWLSGCSDSKRRSRLDSGSCQAGNRSSH